MAGCRLASVGLTLMLLAGAREVLAQEVKLQPWETPGQEAGEQIIGPDGWPMVWVPPGEFTMGANILIPGDNSNFWAPAHRVKITEGFWIQKYPVTRMQYWFYSSASGNWYPDWGGDPGPYYPVPEESWSGATEYAAYYGMQLPTEAQWEYAARGPESLHYPWGNQFDPAMRAYGARSVPVGSFPDNTSWCGAMDMVGLVWQWCYDWFYSSYYRYSPAIDPVGPAVSDALGLQGARVMRGGNMNNEWSDFAAWRRGLHEPEYLGLAPGVHVYNPERSGSGNLSVTAFRCIHVARPTTPICRRGARRELQQAPRWLGAAPLN